LKHSKGSYFSRYLTFLEEFIMRDTICDAIQNRKLLEITYKGHRRIVEPHLIGQKTSGNDALSAWQVGGYSESDSYPPWRNYLLEKIESVTVLEESFSGPRPGYNPSDNTMTYIYCRL